MRTSNIYLIGNGFDLAHGMKTRYSDFINSVENNSLALNNSYPQFYQWKGKERVRKNSLLDFAKTSFWCKIEEAYFHEMFKANKREIKTLNLEFDEIKTALVHYLKMQRGLVPLAGFQRIFDIHQNSPKLIISFNYTNTIDLYKKSYLNRNRIQIHGQLNNEQNPIIFGYAADQKQTEELLHKNDNNYFTNIKQYQYALTNNMKKITNFLNNNQNCNVHILGHSCGLSDKLILQQILGHKHVNSIINYYYEGTASHQLKLININRAIGEAMGFAKYVSFTESMRIPTSENDWTDRELKSFSLKSGRNFMMTDK